MREDKDIKAEKDNTEIEFKSRELNWNFDSNMCFLFQKDIYQSTT